MQNQSVTELLDGVQSRFHSMKTKSPAHHFVLGSINFFLKKDIGAELENYLK
jgi:hypothetical protein